MKKLLLSIAICMFFLPAYGQDGGDSLPYQKNRGLPAFNIRLMDSVTIYNTYYVPKGRAAMIILFSPDCQHCQKFFSKFLPALDSFSNIDLYLVTPYSKMSALRKFYDDNHLGDYKNIKKVGRDYEFFCAGFYGLKSVPDLMLYDKNKKFVKLFDHPGKISEIYGVTGKL